MTTLNDENITWDLGGSFPHLEGPFFYSPKFGQDIIFSFVNKKFQGPSLVDDEHNNACVLCTFGYCESHGPKPKIIPLSHGKMIPSFVIRNLLLFFIEKHSVWLTIVMLLLEI